MSVHTQSSSVHPPLHQIFPWKQNMETVLVNDSIESDGRFVLCAIAAAASNNNEQEQKVLWLSNTTESLTISAIKKIGGKDKHIVVKSIPDALLEIIDSDDNGDYAEEQFIRKLYKSIREWIQGNENFPCWVIVEDISALAAFTGERLSYAFVHSLHNLSKKHSFGLAVRCSIDIDMTKSITLQKQQSDLLGTNEQHDSLDNSSAIPWERTLIEFADTIVDVVPLASGYSREAHGRLLFTKEFQTTIYNYCLHDTQVHVIRIQNPSK